MRKKAIQNIKIADIHCHILPGLDDGPRDMEETLDMLAIARDEGIHHMIATPHYKAGHKNAGTKTIRQRLSEVEQIAKSRGIDVKLYPGNEVLFFSDIENKLEKGQIMTMNDTEYVLLEFLPNNDYTYIRNALDCVRGMGYSPIVAHIERYDCMIRHPEFVKELHDMGMDIQVNAASITGEAGRKSKLFVHKLLKQELVDFVSTDAHKRSGRAPRIRKCAEELYKKYNSTYINTILYENAKTKLLRG